MKNFNFNGKTFPYELSKSRRKSLAITIKPDGAVHVKAPYFVSQKEIEAFLHKKADWITATIDRFSQMEKTKACKLSSGDPLLFLGQEYTFVIRSLERKRAKVSIDEFNREIILAAGHSANAKEKEAALESWFRQCAKEVIHEKAAYFAKILNVTYAAIRVKDQKSLWGSCSAQGNLNFNWRIILAPEEIIDYLVVHELCHRRFMNHSADFWQCVAFVLPKYKQSRKWLKENTQMLKRDLHII
jgi:predicted metal-dependent hydrolase